MQLIEALIEEIKPVVLGKHWIENHEQPIPLLPGSAPKNSNTVIKTTKFVFQLS